MKILATPEKMRGVANTIKQKVNDLQTSQQHIKNIVAGLGDNFSGNLPSYMVQVMTHSDSKFQSVFVTLTQYADFIDNAANAYEQSDIELLREISQYGRKRDTGNNL